MQFRQELFEKDNENAGESGYACRHCTYHFIIIIFVIFFCVLFLELNSRRRGTLDAAISITIFDLEIFVCCATIMCDFRIVDVDAPVYDLCSNIHERDSYQKLKKLSEYMHATTETMAHKDLYFVE